MESLQGCLLIASPRVTNCAFEKAVVLMLRHDERGAMGVLLNRPTSETISGLWKKISGKRCGHQRHVDFGGPVSGPLLALHCRKSLGEFEVPPGIFLAAEKGHLDALIKQTGHPLRIFVGHAGWEEGQLESEVASGAWHIMPANPEHVFGESDDLWATAIRQIGHSFVRDVLGIKEIPAHPSLN